MASWRTCFNLSIFRNSGMLLIFMSNLFKSCSEISHFPFLLFALYHCVVQLGMAPNCVWDVLFFTGWGTNEAEKVFLTHIWKSGCSFLAAVHHCLTPVHTHFSSVRSCIARVISSFLSIPWDPCWVHCFLHSVRGVVSNLNILFMIAEQLRFFLKKKFSSVVK